MFYFGCWRTFDCAFACFLSVFLCFPQYLPIFAAPDTGCLFFVTNVNRDGGAFTLSSRAALYGCACFMVVFRR